MESALVDFGPDYSLLWWAVLYIVGCLAASLDFIPWMPVALPSCDNQKCLQGIIKCLLGGQNCPSCNPVVPVALVGEAVFQGCSLVVSHDIYFYVWGLVKFAELASSQLC